MRIPPEELQKKAKETVLEFIEESEKIRNSHLAEVEDWYKHYRVKESVRTYDGRAHPADAISHENGETIAPRLFEILTNNGELPYESEPVDSDNDENVVKPINELTKSGLKHAKSRICHLPRVDTTCVPRLLTLYFILWLGSRLQ